MSLLKSIKDGDFDKAYHLAVKQNMETMKEDEALDLLKHVARNVKKAIDDHSVISFLKLLKFEDVQERNVLNYLKCYYCILDYFVNKRDWTSTLCLRSAYITSFISPKMNTEQSSIYIASVQKLTKAIVKELTIATIPRSEGQFIDVIKFSVQMQAHFQREDILLFMARFAESVQKYQNSASIGVCLLNFTIDLELDITNEKHFHQFVLLLKSCLFRNLTSSMQLKQNVSFANDILHKLKKRVEGAVRNVLNYLMLTNTLTLNIWSDDITLSGVVQCHQTIKELYETPAMSDFTEEALLFCFHMQNAASNIFKKSNSRASIKWSSRLGTNLEYFMTHAKTQCNLIMRIQSMKISGERPMCCCSLFLSTRQAIAALITALEVVINVHNAFDSNRFIPQTFYAKIGTVISQAFEFVSLLRNANCKFASQMWTAMFSVIYSLTTKLSSEKRSPQYFPFVEQVAQMWYSSLPNNSVQSFIHTMLNTLARDLVEAERTDDALDACALLIATKSNEKSRSIFSVWNKLLCTTKSKLSVWDVLTRKSKYLLRLCPKDKLKLLVLEKRQQEYHIKEIQNFIKRWKGTTLMVNRLNMLGECIQPTKMYVEILHTIPTQWLRTLELSSFVARPENYWQFTSDFDRAMYHYFKFKCLYNTAIKRYEQERKVMNLQNLEDYLPSLFSSLELFERCKENEAHEFLTDIAYTFDLLCLSAESKRALNAALEIAENAKEHAHIIQIVGYLSKFDDHIGDKIEIAKKSLMSSKKQESEEAKLQWEYMRCTFYCQLARYYFRNDDVENARSMFESATSAYYAFGGYLSSYDRKKNLDEDMACAQYALLISHSEMVPCNLKFPGHAFSYDSLLQLILRELAAYRQMRSHANFSSHLALFFEIAEHIVWKSWWQRLWDMSSAYADLAIDYAKANLLSYRLCQMLLSKAKVHLYQQNGNECKAELDKVDDILRLTSAQGEVEQLANELQLNLNIRGTSPVSRKLFRLPDLNPGNKCRSPCLTCCNKEYGRLQLQTICLIATWSEWRGDKEVAMSYYQRSHDLLQKQKDPQISDLHVEILWELAQYDKRNKLFEKYAEKAQQIKATLERKFLRNYFLYNEILLDDVKLSENEAFITQIQRTPEPEKTNNLISIGFATPAMGQNTVKIRGTTPRRHVENALQVADVEEREERTKRLRRKKINLEAAFKSTEEQTQAIASKPKTRPTRKYR